MFESSVELCSNFSVKFSEDYTESQNFVWLTSTLVGLNSWFMIFAFIIHIEFCSAPWNCVRNVSRNGRVFTSGFSSRLASYKRQSRENSCFSNSL